MNRPRIPRSARFLFAIGLVLALPMAHRQAVASPQISVWPGQTILEVPGNQLVPLSFWVSNLDSGGSALLEWTVSDVVHGTEDDCPQASESPPSGSVPPGGTQGLTLTFNTIGLPAAEYLIDLRFDSNDPVHPRLVVPMKLWVVVATGARRATFGELKARYR